MHAKPTVLWNPLDDQITQNFTSGSERAKQRQTECTHVTFWLRWLHATSLL